jgi:hypothetical protein
LRSPSAARGRSLGSLPPRAAGSAARGRSLGSPALVGLALVAALASGACSSCNKSAPGGGSSAAPSGSSGATSKSSPREDAGPPRDPAMWARAGDGGAEDLATLAVHEGAAGLVEAAEQDPALRATAIRAMAHARGWAQSPFLAKAAAAKDEDEARSALEALVDLGSRPRRAEDPEDAEELAEACEKLAALAKDTTREKARRVLALRALRTMPCPKLELPTDLDAK